MKNDLPADCCSIKLKVGSRLVPAANFYYYH